MAHYFGFEPIEQPESFFISYNSEDADRVAPIAKELHEKGVPVWYDRGLTSGDLWERQLADHIESCKAVILFVTKKLLQRPIERNKTPYVRLEYNLATNTYDKTVYVAILDHIDEREVHKDHQLWWQQILLWQYIQKATADQIIKEIGFGSSTPPARPLSAGELFHIGNSFYWGKNGKPKDYAEAAKYYRLAADKGYAKAQTCFGVLCYFGRGVKQDSDEAVRLLRLAAANGDINAHVNLGSCYLSGRGVDQNYAEAVRHFRLAAENGIYEAQVCLGICHKNGAGVKKDYTEAVRLFRLAAEKNIQEAQYQLGRCYENGQGVTKDINEAIRLYRIAANNENNDSDKAEKALARLGVKK